MIVLALAGVAPGDVAADYGLSDRRLPDPDAEEFLTRTGSSAAEVVLSTLASLDLAAELRRGGLADDDLARLRSRLN